MTPLSCYVHVPFCVHRCGYCDFTLVAGRDDLVEPYLAGMKRELELVLGPVNTSAKIPLQTLYWGGGTPSYLEPARLERLFEIVSGWFELDREAEFTLEANPHGLDDQRIEMLARLGCNRVSLGVQSFDVDVLKTLERDHAPEEIARVVERLRRQVPNISIDLIFGVPGQSLECYRQTLLRAIELEPTHLSTYGLTFEKGTSFWSRREHGALLPVDEELERQMYALTIQTLEQAGYRQYEISSFARPGFESRHNQVYWSGQPYHAFGPGASRYLEGRRENNHRSLFTWLKRLGDGVLPVQETEILSAEARARELLMLGLRQIRGVRHVDFQQQTGMIARELMGRHYGRHLDSGLIEDDGEWIRITREGRFIADSVVVDYLGSD